MKEEWFDQWLKKDNYTFWYDYLENEIWRNDKFVIVWHPAIGMRLMISHGQFSPGFLARVFIPQELLNQEK